MSFTTSEVSVIKSLVAFAEKEKFVDLKLSFRDGAVLHTKVPFDFAKKIKSSVKRVSDFDESGYPIMIFLNDETKLIFQFNKNCLSDQMVETDLPQVHALFVRIFEENLFQNLSEKVGLDQLREIVKESSDQDEPEQESIQDTVLDAEDEVMKMLESALGPMVNLLDKKFKQKMSQHALTKIIKSVVGVTLRTVDAETPENEKKVFAAIEESGISGKKEKRAGKLSGYTLFTKQMHQDKKEEFKEKGLKGPDVTKEIGAMWKRLSKEEQQEYNDKAKKENEENPSGSRKRSTKGSRKGSRKGSSKTDKETHKCCFVISKGERKGETCGTTVRSDEPTFEGQWLCSKHTTAEKKKAESNKKDKKEKSSKKKDDEKPKKKTEKKVEEEEEKPKKKKKTEKKVEDDEEEKPSKKNKKVEEEEDVPELERDGAEFDVLNDMFKDWSDDRDNCMISGEMTKENLQKLTGKKHTEKKYDVTLTATKSSLIVKYEEDDEEEMKSIKMDKMTNELKHVHRYLAEMDE
jgi:hypothetical protein